MTTTERDRDQLLAPVVRRVIGWLALASLVALTLFGLWGAPKDAVQGDAQRVMYVHVPSAWVAYLAFITTAVASASYLLSRRRSLGFDRVAGASAEVGVVFMGITLVSGSLWGRLTWGTFWQWDPRLTTTSFLFVTYLGYLAVRGLGGTHHQRAKRSAILAILAVLEIPLVHFSVVFWRSLHQRASVLSADGDVKMDGLMLFTLLVGVVAFTASFSWLVMHRSRVLAMRDVVESRRLDVAIAQRTGQGS